MRCFFELLYQALALGIAELSSHFSGGLPAPLVEASQASIGWWFRRKQPMDARVPIEWQECRGLGEGFRVSAKSRVGRGSSRIGVLGESMV